MLILGCWHRVVSKLVEAGYPAMPRLVLSAEELACEVVPELASDWADSLIRQEMAKLQHANEAALLEEAAAAPPRFVSPFASSSSPDPGEAAGYACCCCCSAVLTASSCSRYGMHASEAFSAVS